MAIRRACSYAATITTPEPPGNYSEILVSFSQNQKVIHSFRLGNAAIVVNDNDIVVRLTQTQTADFQPSTGSPMGREDAQPVYLQVRCYKSPYVAPGSKSWTVDVYDSIEEEELH